MAKKRAAKKATTKECECIKQVDEQLKPHGIKVKRHMTMNFKTGEASMSQPSIEVEKTNRKRGKTPPVFVSYCPFCGVKVPSA